MPSMVNGIELEKLVAVYTCYICGKLKDKEAYKEPCKHCGSTLMKMQPKNVETRNPFVVDERQHGGGI